jgi:hypothetical protein
MTIQQSNLLVWNLLIVLLSSHFFSFLMLVVVCMLVCISSICICIVFLFSCNLSFLIPSTSITDSFALKTSHPFRSAQIEINSHKKWLSSLFFFLVKNQKNSLTFCFLFPLRRWYTPLVFRLVIEKKKTKTHSFILNPYINIYIYWKTKKFSFRNVQFYHLLFVHFVILLFIIYLCVCVHELYFYELTFIFSSSSFTCVL